MIDRAPFFNRSGIVVILRTFFPPRVRSCLTRRTPRGGVSSMSVDEVFARVANAWNEVTSSVDAAWDAAWRSRNRANAEESRKKTALATGIVTERDARHARVNVVPSFSIKRYFFI